MKILKFKELTEGSLPREETVKQLKKLKKITSRTDIGNRISGMEKGANIQYMRNPIDSVESYEDYQKDAHPVKIVKSKSN